MEELSPAPRKPLSPAKQLNQDGMGSNSTPASSAKDHLGARLPSYAESTSKPRLFASRIPRVTPSPEGFRSRHSPSPNNASQSRIPRPRPPAAAVSDADAVFFNSYINPSFEGPSPTPAVDGVPAPTKRLTTPQAVQILEALGQQEGQGMIFNAYLRTGPQKLSPEPSRDYCIAAPKAAAVAQMQEVASRTPAVPAAAVVAGAAVGHLAKSPERPPPEAPKTDDAPPSVCSNIPDDVFADLNDELGEEGPAGAGPKSPVGGAAKNAAATKEVVGSVCVAEPVDSHGHAAREERALHAGGQLTAREWVAAGTGVFPSLSNEREATLGGGMELESPTFNGANSSLQSHHNNRKVSPVAFALPGSDGDEASPPFQQPNPAAETSSGGSAGSFSFGMGGGGLLDGAAGAKHEDDARTASLGGILAAAAPQQELQLCGEGAEEVPRQRPGSDESVDQPNPFVNMLHHLHGAGGGPAYASPRRAPRAASAAAPLESPEQRQKRQTQALLPPLPVVLETNNPTTANGGGSPQSPVNCTPLRLLPDGVPPSCTPELGKGDLQAWIDRRGMRNALSSPAAADLRRMWVAMREGAAARAVVDATAAENEALRGQLWEARAAMERLGARHGEALSAARDGQAWAEAEVARVRAAAHHMMALADQIQATFALCEEEKSALAEELEVAWERAAEAEQEAQTAAAEAAAGVEQRAAAEQLAEELRQAQAAAEAAAAEAAAAQAAARASTAELAAIRAQLESTQEALEGQADGDGSGPPLTPISALRAQLTAAHDALSALHAAGPPPSPQADTLHRCTASGLVQAQALLRDDARRLEDLADGYGGASSSSVDGSPVRVEPPGVERALALLPGSEMKSEGGFVCEASPLPLSMAVVAQKGPASGTATVDFQELRDALEQAAPHSLRLPPACPSSGPTCEVDLEGVVVTNIPHSALSQVRAMVEYFEELAGAAPPAASPGLTPATAPGVLSDYDGDDEMAMGEDDSFELSDFDDEKEEAEVLVIEGAAAAASEEEKAAAVELALEQDDLVSHISASVWSEAEDRQQEQQQDEGDVSLSFAVVDGGAAAGSPAALVAEEEELEENDSGYLEDHSPVPTTVQRLAAWLPPRVGATPTGASGKTPTAPAGQRGPPTTPAPSPADTITPSPQRHHIHSLDAFAALRQVEFGLAETAAAAAEESSDGSTCMALTAVTPGPMAPEALAEAGGSDLRDEVRFRLHRLKAELQAARSKLTHVDQGLAAIATPKPRSAAGESRLLALPAPPPPFDVPAEKTEQQKKERQAPLLPSPPSAVAVAGLPPPVGDEKETVAVLKQRVATSAAAAITPRTTRSVRFAAYVDVCEVGNRHNSQELLQQLQQDSPQPAAAAAAVTAPSVAMPSPEASPEPVVASTRAPAFAAVAAAAAETAESSAGEEEEDGMFMPARRLNLDTAVNSAEESDSSSDDDEYDSLRRAPPTQGSARSACSRHATWRGSNGNTTPYASNGSADSGSGSREQKIGAHYAHSPRASPAIWLGSSGPSATPLSRFSSVSSVSAPSPDPTSLLNKLKPTVGVGRSMAWQRGPSRRPSDSEEREFRRRAAALKIHVSPYFKRNSGAAGAARRAEQDLDVTVD